jgi:hypothetical protein
MRGLPPLYDVSARRKGQRAGLKTGLLLGFLIAIASAQSITRIAGGDGTSYYGTWSSRFNDTIVEGTSALMGGGSLYYSDNQVMRMFYNYTTSVFALEISMPGISTIAMTSSGTFMFVVSSYSRYV